MFWIGGSNSYSLLISDKAIIFSCGHAIGCSLTFAIGNFRIGSEEAGSGLVFHVGHFISNFTSVCFTTFSSCPISSKAVGSFSLLTTELALLTLAAPFS